MAEKLVLVRYIGKQSMKIDNVLWKGRRWFGNGDTVPVPREDALKYAQFPDQWEVVGTISEEDALSPVVAEQEIEKASAEVDAAAEAETPVEETGEVPNPTEVAVSDAAIRAAIETLDPHNPEHFTPTGMPKRGAIEAELGAEITNSDRNRVWATISQK